MECIDILMATYNGEKYLKEQLDSILNQTYKNFRLIISDDCSTDNTRQILKEFCQKDNRIEVILQDKNLGVVSNFEYLMKKVKNKYFMFSDQDDIWKEDKVELSIKKIDSENADIVYTDLEVVDEQLNTINESYWKLKGLDKKIKKYNNFEALYLNNFVTGCTILAKSSWIKEILPIPKDSKYILHDYWTALIISQKGKMVYIDQKTIKYRQHINNSVGSVIKSEQLNTIDEIRELFIDVKLQHFDVFVKNEECFYNDKIKKMNRRALEYYKNLSSKQNISFGNLYLFFQLYQYEHFGYMIKNLIILHFPFLVRRVFYKYKEIKNER